MNPDGTVSESEDEPTCSTAGCTQSVIPGTSSCGDHSTAWPGGSSENGGDDGSLSDGTSPSTDPNSGWVDGTLREDDMTVEEIRLSAYLAEVRAKYTADEIRELGKAGKAIRQADGTYSFPIADLQDATNAAHAIGYSGDSHDGVRSFIMAIADEVGFSVPADWNEDGSIKSSEVRADEAEAEAEADTPGEVETPAEAELEDENEAEVSEAAADEEAERAAAAAAERRERKPRHRSTPAPREEIRDSVVHFGLNDLKVAEIRTGINSQITLEGTPIVYNRSYDVHDMWGVYRETMAPTVCDGVLASPLRLDCRFLINHDGIPLGRTQAGTLELENGPSNLRSLVHLDTRQMLASDLAVAVERGDITQMSCGFIVGEDDWNDDMTQRTIHRFSDLLDVSAVTYPASPTTHIAIAQRMLAAQPLESRARVREVFKIMNEIRAGRTLNAKNAQIITSVLESLHQADDLDPAGFAERAAALAGAHQSATEQLSQITGLELESEADNSDGGVAPINDPGESVRSEDEIAELRRQAVIARRNQLARKRFVG